MHPLSLHTNHVLQALNTLAVPSVASHYVRVSSTEELKRALTLARQSALDVLVLGGGSNVVLPERFAGLVIHMAIKGFTVVAEDSEQVWLRAGAGEVWQDLVTHCLDRQYYGLENLSLIPGTVGAAPIQNIGAYGVELESVFAALSAVEKQSQAVVNFDREGCEFSYRDSVFKNRLKNRYIITEVIFKLSKIPLVNLRYEALREALVNIAADQITPRNVAETVCRIRRGKLPDPAVIPNAGSFFKNPVVSREQYATLHKRYPNIVSYPVDNARVKLAAAWLMEQAGWRGHSQGGVGMHVEQALVLVNPGRCSGGQVLHYAAKVQDDIHRRFGVMLEREPVVYRG
jgi:UDP-N-acetylmuramate dehydrogenase